MPQVIDPIGQLNCHHIGCDTRKRKMVRFDQSIVVVSLLVCQIVSSVCFDVVD